MRAPATAMAAMAAVLFGAGAGACKKTLHWKVIEDELQLKLGNDAPIQRVTCEEGLASKGSRFTCALAFRGGGSADVHIEITDDAGGWRMLESWVSAARAATLIHDGLHKDAHVEATIDCGSGLLLTGHHPCTASNADGSIRMDFELTENGDAKWHPL